MTTGTAPGWIWATLLEMANLAAEREEVEKEAKRLEEAYSSARGRVVEVVPELAIEATVNAVRLLGSPLPLTEADAVSADDPAAPAADPLAIPEYLQRREASGAEGSGGNPERAPAAARPSPET